MERLSNSFLRLLDWFIPASARIDRSQLSLARIFVFTHLAGPALAQSMSVFLYRTDPDPGFACWTIIGSICAFWVLPFALKITKNLRYVALASVALLAFASLFGAFFYGGVSSPFLPWLIISVFLGFFYCPDKPRLLVALFVFGILAFTASFMIFGFHERVPMTQLSTLGWISILSATVYMSWMAVYYNIVISMRSDLQVEAERHRATAVQLERAKEAAERANHAKSIFLAKMSHELRTPLNAVIGYSEILLEDNLDRENSTKVADLKRINSAGKHLLSLVNDVLDLAKIESDKIDLQIKTVDPVRFAKQICATMQPLAEQNGNTLSLKCEGDLGEIETDPTKLRQVVINLISNAAKFTKAGKITMTVVRTKGSMADWFEIRVEDTGIGISDSDLPNLFQNFGQAATSGSKKYGGTGLGLAISQKLCGLMGGGISCVSELGRGSTFVVRIPARLSRDLTHTDEAIQSTEPVPALALATA
jgi:signal transduction histidine kinase